VIRIIGSYFSSFVIGIIIIILGNPFWMSVGMVFTIFVVGCTVLDILRDAMREPDE